MIDFTPGHSIYFPVLGECQVHLLVEGITPEGWDSAKSLHDLQSWSRTGLVVP